MLALSSLRSPVNLEIHACMHAQQLSYYIKFTNWRNWCDILRHKQGWRYSCRQAEFVCMCVRQTHVITLFVFHERKLSHPIKHNPIMTDSEFELCCTSYWQIKEFWGSCINNICSRLGETILNVASHCVNSGMLLTKSSEDIVTTM